MAQAKFIASVLRKRASQFLPIDGFSHRAALCRLNSQGLRLSKAVFRKAWKLPGILRESQFQRHSVAWAQLKQVVMDEEVLTKEASRDEPLGP